MFNPFAVLLKHYSPVSFHRGDDGRVSLDVPALRLAVAVSPYPQVIVEVGSTRIDVWANDDTIKIEHRRNGRGFADEALLCSRHAAFTVPGSSGPVFGEPSIHSGIGPFFVRFWTAAEQERGLDEYRAEKAAEAAAAPVH